MLRMRYRCSHHMTTRLKLLHTEHRCQIQNAAPLVDFQWVQHVAVHGCKDQDVFE